MRRVAALLRALATDWLRSREAVFFAFAFPVVLLLIFGAVFGGGAAEFTVHVQNHDTGPDGEPTDLSATFVDSLDGVEAVTVERLDPDRNLTAWSREGRTLGAKRAVVVPDGFAAGVRDGSVRARRTVIADTLNRTDGSINETRRAAMLRGAGGDGTEPGAGPDPEAGPGAGGAAGAAGPNATVAFLTTADDESAPAVRGIVDSVVARFNDEAIGVDRPPVAVETGDLGGGSLGSVDYYLPALVAAVVLLNGVVTVTATVASFTHEGTLKRLAATPVRKRDWIAATVVLQTVLALAVTGVMVLVARLAFGVTIVPGPLALALVLVGAVAFTAAGVVLGSLLDDPDAATSLGNAIALPMMFLSGVFWEIELMPETLRTVATVLPLYHFHRGLRRLMVLDTTEGVWLPFAVLGGGAVALLALAVRTTRWRDFDA